MATPRKKRRFTMRRKRSLDRAIDIDYKNPDTLKRFITDRGKIIPRRISGATSSQQRAICKAVKRARYLGLLAYSVAHRTERGFANEMAAIAASLSRPSRPGGPRDRGSEGRGSEGRGRDGGAPRNDDFSSSESAE